MKEKINNALNVIKENFVSALLLTMVGVALSFLLCTVIAGSTAFMCYLPIIVFVIFFAIYFMMESIEYTASRKWLKALILVLAIIVFVIITQVI